MNNFFVFLVISLCVVSTSNAQITTKSQEEFINQYFNALKSEDWKLIAPLVPEEKLILHLMNDNFEQELKSVIPSSLYNSTIQVARTTMKGMFFIELLEAYRFQKHENNKYNFWKGVSVVEIGSFKEYDDYYSKTNQVKMYSAHILLYHEIKKEYFYCKLNKIYNYENKWYGAKLDYIEQIEKAEFHERVQEYETAQYANVATVEVATDSVGYYNSYDTTMTVSVYGDVLEASFQGNIKGTTYQFNIMYSKLEAQTTFHYLEDVKIIVNDQKENYKNADIISQLSPRYIIKEASENTIYYLKFNNENEIEVTQIDENGNSSGAFKFQKTE